MLDGIFHPQVVTHDFECGDTASANFRQQALRDDPANGFRQPDADLLFFRLVEHTDNTIDRLAGVDRVQRAHDQVAGFRGGHADFDSFTVAHFTDENDLRRLAQRGAQAGGECAEVVSHFPLIERRLLLRVHELDRVFECHDVHRLRFVQFIQQRSQRRGFSASGRARNQHESGLLSRSCEKLEEG